MDITPIYDLRARLRAATIAGTNLLSEDFRLKRAVEAFAPLEQASPVFAKIGQLSRALLDSAQADKEGVLLDTITLVDAVLCTQGAVSADTTNGHEIEKLPGNTWGRVITNAPYSVVSTLIEALTSSGSGHFSYVTETREAHPELFSDYRVKAAMVQALGASYSELAELVETWLKEEDASILFLLKKQFDPEGKKEMVRRIRVIEAIAPKEANDFFVEQLTDAKKEVRQTLIFALRHCPENENLLWELSQIEKGNSKKVVYHALAHMESNQVEQFFTDLYQKKPQEAMQYLIYTKRAWAARLVAKALEEQLQPFEERGDYSLTEEQALVLQTTLMAAAGKTGPEMIEALKKVILLEEKLDYPFADKKKKWGISFLLSSERYRFNPDSSKDMSFQKLLVNIIQLTLLRTANLEVGRFAMEIYEEKQQKWKGGENYFSMAVLAHLLFEEDCSEWLLKQLFGFGHSSKLHESLFWVLRNISWSEERQAFIIEDIDTTFELLDGYRMRYVHTLKQDMTGKIADILMKCRNAKLDSLLPKYVSQRNEDYRAKLEDYYYRRALEVSDNRSYLRTLKNLGYKGCEGLAVHYFKHGGSNTVALWTIKYFESYYLPGDNLAKYREMQKVYELVQHGKLKLNNSANAKQEFLAYLEELKG